VAAYEIDTNTIVWVQPLPIDSGSQIRSLFTDETTIGAGTGGSFLLDASTGEITGEQNVEIGTFGLWYMAVSPLSSSKPFEFTPNQDREIHQSPILLDESIVFRTGSGWLLGKVHTFDRQTKTLLWETDKNVVSNVAVDQSTAYFLTDSAELIARYIRTGRVVGKVEFAPKDITAEDDRGFYVAADDNHVFVYFGDSRQLFALNLNPQ
jgi:outer membrane protein assembly factor BamB